MSRTSHQTKSQKRNLLGVSSRLRRASPLTLITQSTFGFEFRGIHHGFQKGPFRPFGLTFPPHHSLRAQPRSPGVLPSMLDVVLWSPLSPRPSRPESPSPFMGWYVHVCFLRSRCTLPISLGCRSAAPPRLQCLCTESD